MDTRIRIQEVPRIVIFAVICFLCFGCTEQVASEKMKLLKTDIASTEAEIQRAESEDAKYDGGLIQALIRSRLGVLRQTLAMLKQREKSWIYGISVKYKVDGRPYNPPHDAEKEEKNIEKEIQDMEGKIIKQEAESSMYSGGLIQAFSLSTLATMRMTYAMLDQRRLALKYGFPQYTAPENIKSKVSPSLPSTKREKDFEIVAVDMRVTESNSTWWRVAWKLTLINKAEVPQVFDATLEFQDKDGFVISSDNEYGLTVAGNNQKTFTGYQLVNAQVAHNITMVNAKVGKRQ